MRPPPAICRRRGPRTWPGQTALLAQARLRHGRRSPTIDALSVYRDPHGALAGQVAAKRAVLAERARGLSPLLRAVAPRALKTLLADASLHEGAAPDAIEDLKALDERLDAALAAHDQVQARVWSLRLCPHDVPELPRPREPPPWLIEEPPVLAFRRALAARIERVAPEATLVRRGDFAYLARFTASGAPMQLHARAKSDPNIDVQARAHVALRTSVPESLPWLEVRPKRLLDAVGEALGLAHEWTLGDPPFDDMFWVTGDRDVLAVLTADVRRALCDLEEHTPRFVVGEGLAELTWTSRWRHADAGVLPDAALVVVSSVRRAIEG